MALTTRMMLRQGQSLVMTPQLLQAIKLLQLSHLELTAFVQEELDRNPLLERSADNEDEPSTAENEAALALAYVMFLESARMEKQIAEDLAACELPAGADGVDAAAEACRRLAAAEERRRLAMQEQAAAYRRDKRRDN